MFIWSVSLTASVDAWGSECSENFWFSCSLEDAVAIHKAVASKKSVAMHWGM